MLEMLAAASGSNVPIDCFVGLPAKPPFGAICCAFPLPSNQKAMPAINRNRKRSV